MPTEFPELFLQLGASRFDRLHPEIVLTIDLLQPAQFGLSGDQLPGKGRGHIDHRPPLLLDIDGGVLAGKLAEAL